MGWYFGAQSKEAVIREVEEVAEGYTITDRQTVGNQHWYVVKGGSFPTGIICLALIEREGQSWGYKPMDESVGPFYYACPLRMLDAVPAVFGKVSDEWREKVKAFHHSKRGGR